MPYVIGIVLSVGVALFARSVDFDRDRVFKVLENSGMPVWRPAFCLTYDLGAAASLAWLVKRGLTTNDATQYLTGVGSTALHKGTRPTALT